MSKRRKPEATARLPMPTRLPKEATPPDAASVRDCIADAVSSVKAAYQSLIDAEADDDAAAEKLPSYHRVTLDTLKRRLWITAGALEAIKPADPPKPPT